MLRKIRLAFLIVGSVFALAQCASTSHLKAGNPLPGIGLGASGSTLLLSWAEKGPLAARMQTGARVDVLASYPTEYGPVTNEVISNATVRARFPGLKFELPQSLDFHPTGPVCLRLAMGRTAIPLRISNYSESSDGFYYSEWEEVAKLNSQRATKERTLLLVEQRIETFNEPAVAFESWKSERALVTEADCGKLRAEASLERPITALTGAEKGKAVKNQCVALYKNTFSRYPFTFDPMQLAQKIKAAVPADSSHAPIAQSLLNDLSNYPNPRTLFKNSYFPIDVSSVNALIYSSPDSNKKITEVTAKSILESYDACQVEVEERINYSYESWQESLRANTLTARSELLRKECRARFAAESGNNDKLQQLIDEKAKLEAELAVSPTTLNMALPEKKLLIPYACPADP